jgi:transcriptional regulator with XRE-family HTH domain
VRKKKIVDPTIGQRLLQLRQGCKKTQAEVAEPCNISRQTLSCYECGKVAIPSPLFAPLARQLHCKPSDLLDPPGSPLPRYRYHGASERQRSPKITSPCLFHAQVGAQQHVADQISSSRLVRQQFFARLALANEEQDI